MSAPERDAARVRNERLHTLLTGHTDHDWKPAPDYEKWEGVGLVVEAMRAKDPLWYLALSVTEDGSRASWLHMGKHLKFTSDYAPTAPEAVAAAALAALEAAS